MGEEVHQLVQEEAGCKLVVGKMVGVDRAVLVKVGAQLAAAKGWVRMEGCW